MAADAWGIEDGYWDAQGLWHDTPETTRRALRVAMGGHVDLDDPPPRARPVWFVAAGSAPAVERPAEVVLEDGTTLQVARLLPPDLPLGYHDLEPVDGGQPTRLIVVPPRCHLPDDLHTWGFTVQVHATRSRHSWGVGDLDDLAALSRWSRDLGAGVVAISPLHAGLPMRPQEPSPYFPSSRRFRSPLFIRIEDVPGWDPSDPVLADAAAAGRALDDDRFIDRDRAYALKLAALEHLWAADGGASGDAFDEFVAAEGDDLRQYAVFCALVEHHGRRWPGWPAEHRRPDAPGVARFAHEHADRVRFHSWVQWLLDEQLRRAGNELPIIGDLAVGIDPGGADSWVWQDIVAAGVRVGAPPDEFNTVGQDWGFPPFVPWRLRAAGYEPLARTVRAALRHNGALRIDHVMGLFRLFWIPPGAGPTAGTYVRYPATELLDVVALESVRAGAWIVGEDLGTVEDESRQCLADRGVLSYRLLWFEAETTEAYPRQALAAVTTHDLPTIAGLWSGSDLADQQAFGLEPNEEGTATLRRRLAEIAGVTTDASLADVVRAAYGRLARAPSMVATATLEDALGVEERSNLPGTTHRVENWSLALPVPLEDIVDRPDVLALTRVLADGRAATKPPISPAPLPGANSPGQ
jgi:4-alpha-glucanotransferase